LSVVPIPAVAASVPQVALFGLFGATTSTILSLRAVSTRIDTDPSLPDPSIDLEMTIARLLFGVIAAIALYVMLVGGVLNPALVTGSGGGGLVLAVAFAAGFSERLLVNATERFVDAVGDDD
jgi:cytochrome b561